METPTASQRSTCFAKVQRRCTASQLHDTHQQPWQTGIWKHLPWTGLLSLFGGFLCGVAAVLTAHSFDDKPLDHWKINDITVQPTVLLSVLATVSKACLTYAFTTGLAIFWWKIALLGTTLRQLDACQQQSSSLKGLCRKRPVFSSVALASAAMLLLMAEGPFLQRALQVVTRERNADTELTIPISPSPLMWGSTGIIMTHGRTMEPTMYNPLFARVLQQYDSRDNISLTIPSCQGICLADVLAPGWDVECTTNTSEYRLMALVEFDDWQNAVEANQTWTGPSQRQPTYSTNVTFDVERVWNGAGDEYEFDSSSNDSYTAYYDNFAWNFKIKFSTRYKATEGVRGSMVWRTCTMSEALVYYKTSIIGQTISLSDLPQMSSRIVQRTLRHDEPTFYGNSPSTIGGLWLAVKDRFEALAEILAVGPWYTLATNSTIASVYLRGRNASVLMTSDMYWADPTDDMISMLQELAFRTAVVSSSEGPTAPTSGEEADPAGYDASVISPDLNSTKRLVQQQATVSMTHNETVYAVRFGWLAGGFALIALACLAILPTYWGWWRLGRAVSLSPLEIAKAFDAPLMQVLDSNATSEDIVRAVGDKRVRYGFATSSTDRDGRSSDFVDHGGLCELCPQIRESSSGEFARDVVERWAQDGFVPSTTDEHTSEARETDRAGAMEMSTLSHKSLAPSQTISDDDIASQSVVLGDRTVANGIAASTAVMVPATSPLLWRFGTRGTLRFREEREGRETELP